VVSGSLGSALPRATAADPRPAQEGQTSPCTAPRNAAATATSSTPRAWTPTPWSACRWRTTPQGSGQRRGSSSHYQPILRRPDGRHLRGRGPAALEPSGPRPAPPRRVPLAGRDHRPLRPGRPLGAAHRLARAAAAWQTDLDFPCGWRSTSRRAPSSTPTSSRGSSACSSDGLAASSLELEITETLAMQDARRASPLLSGFEGPGGADLDRRLRTGLLVLSYLTNFPSTRSRWTGSFVVP